MKRAYFSTLVRGRIWLPNQANDSLDGHVPAWDLTISCLTKFQQANTSANINNQSHRTEIPARSREIQLSCKNYHHGFDSSCPCSTTYTTTINDATCTVKKTNARRFNMLEYASTNVIAELLTISARKRSPDSPGSNTEKPTHRQSSSTQCFQPEYSNMGAVVPSFPCPEGAKESDQV